MNTDNLPAIDGLLAALDQFTNAVYWYQDRHPVTAAVALTEAIDEWVGEHAAGHHQSHRFTTNSDEDPLASALLRLAAAVSSLRTEARPGLIVNLALGEALDVWAAEQAAEHHHSEPFQRPAVTRFVERVPW